MYKIEKLYYTGIDETKVRLIQKEPYRDFVVSFKGDLSDLSDDILEQRAIAKLAREFNPSNALDELEERVKKQAKILLKLSFCQKIYPKPKKKISYLSMTSGS